MGAARFRPAKPIEATRDSLTCCAGQVLTLAPFCCERVDEWRTMGDVEECETWNSGKDDEKGNEAGKGKEKKKKEKKRKKRKEKKEEKRKEKKEENKKGKERKESEGKEKKGKEKKGKEKKSKVK